MKVKLICTSVRISTDLIQTRTQNRPAAPQTETPVTTYTTGLWSPVRDKQIRKIVLFSMTQKHTQINTHIMERKRGRDSEKDVYVTDRNKSELPRSVTVMDTAEELSAPCLFLASQ